MALPEMARSLQLSTNFSSMFSWKESVLLQVGLRRATCYMAVQVQIDHQSMCRAH